MRNKLLLFLVAYLLALLVQLSLPGVLDPLALVGGLVSFLLVLLLARAVSLALKFRQMRLEKIAYREPKLAGRRLNWIFSFAFFFLLSAIWISCYHLNNLNQRLPAYLEGEELLVTGKIDSLIKSSTNKNQFDFQVEKWMDSNGHEIERRGAVDFKILSLPALGSRSRQTGFPKLGFLEPRLPKKLKLSWYEYVDVKPGQQWQFLVKLKRPRATLNSAGFDYETWLYANAYGATGYIRRSDLNMSVGAVEPGFDNLRANIKRRLLAEFSNEEYLPMVLALAIGDRSLLQISEKDILQKTGTSHLLAISGMHVGFVALWSYLIFYAFCRGGVWLFSFSQIGMKFSRKGQGLMPQQIAAALCILVALIYALIAGFSLPTQRALIMVSCYCAALIFVRKTDYMQSYMLALLLVLVWDPMAVFSLGFYLSFAAVFIIQWVLMSRYVARESYLKTLVKLQFAIVLGLAPLILLGFSSFYPISIVTNIIAIPLVAWIILPLILLAIVVWAGAELLALSLFEFALFLLGILFDILGWFAQIDLLVANFSPDFFSMFCLFVGFLLLLTPLPLRVKMLSWVFLVPVLALQGTHDDRGIARGEFLVTLLDVGQGLSVVLETPNHVLVYDTGPPFGVKLDAGTAILKPYLDSRHYKKIDTLILSHGDIDHVGGAGSLLGSFQTERVISFNDSWLPEKLAGLKSKAYFPANHEYCDNQLSWVWNDVKFEFLFPQPNHWRANAGELTPNNLSCVLKVSGKQVTLLLPGDIEKYVEGQLVEDANLQGVDILVAAHHGSKTSTSKAFVKGVNPKLVLISAGYRNRYGHPHQSVLKRLARQNIPFFNTAEVGAISLNSEKFDPDNPEKTLGFARQKQQYFWRF